MRSSRHRSKNHLLSILTAADFALLKPHLRPIVLPLRHVLEVPNQPIRQVFFMESGIASIVAIAADKRQIETGITGREGMSGIPVLMGDDRSPNAVFIQVAGSGQSLPAADLRRGMARSAAMTAVFLRFAHAFSIQTAHTALANGRGIVEQRLARWLLMAHDRLGVADLPLTHEFLALMLGVRRASVTNALHVLAERGLVETQHAVVVILDRGALENFAGGIYGTPEAEYRRLLGSMH